MIRCLWDELDQRRTLTSVSLSCCAIVPDRKQDGSHRSRHSLLQNLRLQLEPFPAATAWTAFAAS